METLGYLPTSLVAGESINVDDILINGYTPASWTLTYEFAASAPSTATATQNDAATGWDLAVTAATTLAWAGGSVQYAGFVEHSDGRKIAVDYGTIQVAASPLRVSSWVAVIAAIDAAMLTVGTHGAGSIAIDGMTVSYKSATDLINLREYAQQQLRRDTANRQKRIIRSRFTVC